MTSSTSASRTRAASLRIDADADVARVVAVAVVEQVLAAERARDRQPVRSRRSAASAAQASRVPSAAADDHERRRRAARAAACAFASVRRRRRGWPRPRRAADRRTSARRGQHVLRQREHDRPGPAGHRDAVGVRDVFGDALGAIDLRGPLGHAAVHPPIVDLLERFAIDEVAADLADEHDHRRRILHGGVDADRGVRRARAARDEARCPGVPVSLPYASAM